MNILASVLAPLVWLGVHPPPTVHLQVEVRSDGVRVDVVAELHVWNAWLGTNVSADYLLSDKDCALLQSKGGEFFARANRFSVDGVSVSPVVTEVIPPTDFIPGRSMPSVRIRLRVAAVAEPRTFGVLWQTFELTDWFERPAIPAAIEYRGDIEQAVLTPTEPEYVWHTRVVTPRKVRLDAVPAEASRSTEVSVVSLLLLCGGVGWAAASRRQPMVAGIGLLGFALGALATRSVGVVRLPGSGVAVPSGAAALQVFERLQGNVYRAFEATSPEDVYDLLAVSVAPDVLDELYADVYESLVLRGQGGAVCKVDRLEVLERDLAPSSSGTSVPGFDVACHWRVHGRVSHWGHEHKRMNEYRATYSVIHDGRSWKIGRVVVLEQNRVDENG